MKGRLMGHTVGRVVFLAVGAALLLGGGCKDRTAPGNPTGFAATAGEARVDLAWTNPADGDLQSVRVRRATTGYPAGPEEGDLVYEGLDGAAADTGLANGALYYYAAFAVDHTGNWSSGVQASATPAAVLTGDFTALGDAVRTAGVFDADQQQRLLQLLDDANALADGGDACGAGDKLAEFGGVVQELRSGAAAPVCEQLFNEGRMLRRAVALGSPAKDDCPGFARVDLPVSLETDPAATDPAGVSLKAAFGEPLLATARVGEFAFTKSALPGLPPLSGAPGRPLVPGATALIAVPEGAEVTVAWETEPAETIKMNLWPGQPETMDALDFYATPPFTLDAAAYDSPDPYPAEVVSVRDAGRVKGLRVFQMEVAGGQYAPASETLELFAAVNVRLEFTGGSGQFGIRDLADLLEAQEDPVLGGLANWGVVEGGLQHLPIVAGIQGEELMILAPPELREAADRLAEHKNGIGVVTRVFAAGDGAGPGPDTPAEIDELIEAEYGSAAPRPGYVLLFGDAEYLPPAYYAPWQDTESIGSPTIGTDWIYAVVGQDPASALLPDLAVGRLPLDTPEEADRMVDRIIAYETAPPDSADYYSRASIASQFQCCNKETTTAGVDQRTFIWVSERIRNVMNGRGKTVDRFYTKTVDAEYTLSAAPKYYFNGDSLPDDLRSGFSWNAGTMDVVNAFNAGRFMVIHRDHGSPGAWEHPWFRWSNVYGDDPGDSDPKTANAPLFPVVFSVNCASSMFDDETSGGHFGIPADFDLLMERLLRDDDGGAIAVFGDVRNSPSNANSVLLLGFLDAVWPELVPSFVNLKPSPRMGDMLRHGKAYLASMQGKMDYVGANEVRDEALMWHLFGDPTLPLWTENPHTRALPQPTAMAWTGLDTVRVVLPANGVTVTVTQENAFGNLGAHGRGVTANGVVDITLNGLPDRGRNASVHFRRNNSIPLTFPLTEIVPPGPVTGFTAVPYKDIIMLGWTNPGGDFSYVRIMRRNDRFPASPSDGTMVVNGNGTSHYDGVFPASTPCYYTAFTFDGNGNHDAGTQAFASTWSDITAPPNATGLTAVPGDGAVLVFWTNPESSDFAGVVVVRKEGSAPFSNTDGAAAYQGTGTSFLDTGLVNGTTYYYRAFTYDLMPNYASGTGAVSATPADTGDTTPPGDVSGFDAVLAGAAAPYVQLSWTNPVDADFAGVVIRRSTSGYPATPTDGDAVYNGADSPRNDPNPLTPGNTYYYTCFAYDTSQNHSAGVTADVPYPAVK